jgi:predicted CopG family antitoxin
MEPKIVREWDEAAFRQAYSRYKKFFEYVEKVVKGNPSIKEILEEYLPGKKDDQMELLVVYDVVVRSQRYKLPIRDIKRVRLFDGGRTEVAS